MTDSITAKSITWKLLPTPEAPRHPEDGYRHLANAVLWSAVRDADLSLTGERGGSRKPQETFHNPTPTRRAFEARRFLVTDEECGGWCILAGLDPSAFIERMRVTIKNAHTL